MENKIYLSSPHMTGNEIKYIQQAINENWVAPLGPNVDNFEKELSNYLDVGSTAVLSSGTAAMHLALILLGVSSGDEVIAPSFTFSASINPIVYQGASPILIDSEEETWNMCPDLLEKAIKDRLAKGKKPKAIILVHLYGMPAKIEEIINIANKYEIPVIEDAAESLGSKYKNQHTGTFGKFGILSFNGNKIITSSGGGALFSNDYEAIRKSRFLATQAKDDAPHYQHSQIGYNYRMSNIVAGIGRAQLEAINKRVEQRRNVFNFYKTLLKKYDFISFLDEIENNFSNRWLTTITFDFSKTNTLSLEKIRTTFSKENIETRPLWKPMHLQPIFKNYPAFVNGVSEKLFNNGLCLPSGSNLTESQKSRINSVINKTFKKQI